MQLAAIGVPTITPVALGEQRKRKFLFENYLVTPAISDTIPLDEFVERRLPRVARAEAIAHPPETRPGRRRDDGPAPRRRAAAPRLSSRQHPAARRSCRGARALHDRSRCHEEMPSRHLEAGQAEPGAARSLFLAEKQPDRPVSIPEGVSANAKRAARRGSAVCQGDRRHDAPLGGTALAAVGPALPVVEQVLRGLSRPHTWCVASRDLDPSEISALLDDPDLPFESPEAILLKNSRTTTVAETTMLVRGCPQAVIYKRFNRKKWLDPLLSLFRPSRAWRSWQAGQDLASRGIPTPQNLAFLSRRRSWKSDPLFWFLPHETYLITVKQEARMSLASYVRDVLPALPPRRSASQDPQSHRVAGRLDPLAARSIDLAPRSEGLEHLDRRRPRRSEAISSA